MVASCFLSYSNVHSTQGNGVLSTFSIHQRCEKALSARKTGPFIF